MQLVGQIDYIAASSHVDGIGRPISFLDLQSEEALCKKMDHRPVKAELSWKYHIRNYTPDLKGPARTLPKGGFPDAVSQEAFKRCTVQAPFLNLPFSQFEGQLFHVAGAFLQGSGSNSKSLQTNELKTIRRSLRVETCVDRRKDLTRLFWRKLQQRQKQKLLKRLG